MVESKQKVQDLIKENKKYFQNELAEFIYFRTYSRWIPEKKRREVWTETVNRYIDFMKENLGQKLTQKDYDELYEAILHQEIMPSMRLLWSSGEAARKTNMSAYNCSFISPSKITDFAEIMYILMCGTGVGFSVESNQVKKFPKIKKQTEEHLGTHTVEDSKEGWGNAMTTGVNAWFNGQEIYFDYSKLRPAGARLQTMGGQSSGPDPLKNLLDFTREKILSRQGKKLRTIDVHDIVCKIGEIIVMGGVRRSALISLSDLNDTDMRMAKVGEFWEKEPQRFLSNNSAIYNKKPNTMDFLREWTSLVHSGTGERGIFNRGNIFKNLPERRKHNFKGHLGTCGTNPCGEIILRNKQLCNLTEVVAREDDTEDSLSRKIRLATILGTYQSSLTDFPYVSKEWAENCEEERLLGVSITGQWDSPAVRDKNILEVMKEIAIETNKDYAVKFGINQSTAITCVKPSGTVSQLVNSSSGMHPRHAKYYIRRVRISATDPLFQMIKKFGYPYHPEVGQDEESAATYVLDFPVKSPEASVTKDDISTIEQLKHWELLKRSYTEHNPSITISVGDDEWIECANWLYKNWDIIGGLSFLPRDNAVYELMPYESISKEVYEKMISELPKISFGEILLQEKEDNTTGSHELACVSGVCSIDDAPVEN